MSKARTVRCICCWGVLQEAWEDGAYLALCDDCVEHRDNCRHENEAAAESKAA